MDLKQYEITKERIHKLCENAGTDDEKFVIGAKFGVLIGISVMAKQLSDLALSKVTDALAELPEVADIFKAAEFKENAEMREQKENEEK